MRYRFLSIFLWLLLTAFTEDPIKISVRDVLTSAHKESRVVSQSQTVDFLDRLNYRLPLVKSLGFKFGADDFTNSGQQYATALGFNSLKVIKAQQGLKTAQIGVYQAKKDALISQVVQERYLNVVDMFFSQTILGNQRSLDTLLNQKNTVLKLSLQKGMAIKIKDLVETEDDIRSLRLLSAEMNTILGLSQQRIQEYMGLQNTVALSFDNFIALPKLKEVLNILKTNRNIQTPELKVTQSKINLAQSELHAEEAAFKQVFDGFQLIYENKNKSDFSTRDFSFRLGFNIPIKGNLRPKQNELLLDIKSAENDYQATLFETDRELKGQVLMLENCVNQYQICLETLSNSLSNNLLSTPSVLATLAPSDIVDLKIMQQKKRIELTKMQYTLIKEYIKLLSITGDLTAAPYKNYLSNALEKW
jgi:hypothetical protein